MRKCICEQTGWLKAGTLGPRDGRKDTSSAAAGRGEEVASAGRAASNAAETGSFFDTADHSFTGADAEIHNEQMQALREEFLAVIRVRRNSVAIRLNGD